MILKELLKDVNFVCKDESILEKDIKDIKIDHRLVEKGDLFIALKGQNRNGNDFIERAKKNGAVAVISDEKDEDIVVKNARSAYSLISKNYFGRFCDDLKLIAVTGTNGKTSTANLIYDILAGSGYKAGVIGTLGAKFGNNIVETGMTTPDPYKLHSLFRDMRAKGVEYVAMEASAHAIFLNKLDGLKFEVGLFTNISEDHLDFFKNMENYTKAKLKLFDPKYVKTALYNEKLSKLDNYFKKLGIKTEKYGFSSDCDFHGIMIKQSLDGVKFICKNKDCKYNIVSPVIGKFNIENMIGAIGACKNLGLSDWEILKGISNIKPVEGRFNVLHGQNKTIIIDFAHTPDGLQNLIKTARAVCPNQKIVTIFGCGGNRDKIKRPIMGKIASELSDSVIITSDNPRYEDPLDIISDIRAGISKNNFKVISNRLKAIEYAMNSYKNNEVVLIAGKGGEKYQEINGVKYPFDEFEIVNKFLSDSQKKDEFLKE